MKAATAVPDVAQDFAGLAADVATHQPEAAVAARLARLERACEAAAAAERAGTRRTLLANVSTAVATWREVWPRLGGRLEFRAAIVREARLWAKRLGPSSDGR